MEMALKNLILHGWFEASAVIFLCLSLMKKELPTKKILLYGFILASITWLVRIMPIPFGIHTLVYCIGLMLIMYMIARTSFGKTFTTVFIGLFVLICAETLVHVLYEILIGGVSFVDGWLWLLLGWPQIIIIFLLALLIKRLK